MLESGFSDLDAGPIEVLQDPDIPEEDEDDKEPTLAARPPGSKPHEERIVANCVALKLATDVQTRSRLEAALYDDLLSLCRALLIKKYGFNGRVDVMDIAHSAASSALMTVILRNKEVYSWVQLLRKMCHDWACKWMKSNLYSSVELVSLDETREDDEDGGKTQVYDLPYYDVDPIAVRFLHTHIAATATKVETLLAELNGPMGNIMSRLVLEKAFYGRDAVIEYLPPRIQARINLCAHRIGMMLRRLADPQQLRKDMF
jgi:hypothetical protein